MNLEDEIRYGSLSINKLSAWTELNGFRALQLGMQAFHEFRRRKLYGVILKDGHEVFERCYAGQPLPMALATMQLDFDRELGPRCGIAGAAHGDFLRIRNAILMGGGQSQEEIRFENTTIRQLCAKPGYLKDLAAESGARISWGIRKGILYGEVLEGENVIHLTRQDRKSLVHAYAYMLSDLEFFLDQLKRRKREEAEERKKSQERLRVTDALIRKAAEHARQQQERFHDGDFTD